MGQCAPLSHPLESLLERLREQGLRITDQRRALLEFLLETSKGLTVAQIYQGLQEQGVQMDEASVYRSIKTLKDIQVVHELAHGQVSLCQHSSCGQKHLHMSWQCEKCGKAYEPQMKSKDLKDLEKILKFKHNKISHVSVAYLCSDCQ